MLVVGLSKCRSKSKGGVGGGHASTGLPRALSSFGVGACFGVRGGP